MGRKDLSKLVAELKTRKRIGVRDLARLAEVDASTVSRALRNDPCVNEERARAIRELAEQVGYRPRPLRSKHAQAVGVLIGSSRADRIGGKGEHFLERIAWIAQQILGERHLHVNLECILRDEKPTPIPALVQQNRVDGVLLAGHPPVDLVRAIRELDLPAVAINDSVERLGISSVRSEPGPAIHECILRLAAWGHRQFGLLLNELESPTAKARHQSYQTSLRDIGIEPDPAWLVSDLPGELAGGREGVRQLKARGPLPSAILCSNDWLAMGAMQELHLQGCRIPEDISLVGHDDLPFCEDLEPTLTSIHRAEKEIVAKAVDLLSEEIEHGIGEPREILVEGVMVWRNSTGMAPARRAGQS